MKSTHAFFIIVAVTAAGFLPTTYAQKGMGDKEGIVRQSVKPEVLTLSGEIVEIKTGPCENTTGRSILGTHLIIQGAGDQRINLHLGPTDNLKDIMAATSEGQSVEFDGFRTKKMPEDHYVAKALTLNGKVYPLRDDTFQPVWASEQHVRTGSGQRKGSKLKRGRGIPANGGCRW